MGAAPGYTAMELLAKASLAAIADAGLVLNDIDAVFSMLPQDPFCAMSVPEYLGIRPKIVETTRTGGSAFQIHAMRSEEHTSELQSLMRISYAVFCLKNTNNPPTT